MNSINELLTEKEIDELENVAYNLMLEMKTNLTEGVLDNMPTDILDLFDEMAKRIDAARRGLGLANKLPPGEQKQEQKRRVMGNLNRLRSALDRVLKDADSRGFAANQQLAMAGNQNKINNTTRPMAASPHQALPGRNAFPMREGKEETEYEWELLSYEKGEGWSLETTEESAKEIRARLREYEENAPGRYKIKKVKVKK